MEFFVDPRNEGPVVVDPPVRTPTPPEGGWAAWHLRDEDDVGEGTEQGITVRTLLAALTELARERGWARTLVAGDQFFAWVEAEPLVRISPDVYLLDDPPGPPYPGMWRTWLPGQAPPRFAVEVVSEEWTKDYVQAPRKYDQLGTRELVVFDPEAALAPPSPRGRRVALQVFRRDGDGALVQVDAGEGPFHSAELDAWLVVQRGPASARLRLARDAAGTDLIATAEERVDSQDIRIQDLEAVVALQQDLLAQQATQLAQQATQLAEQAAHIAEQAAHIARQAEQIDRQAAVIARQADQIDQQAAQISRQSALIDRQAAQLTARIEQQAALIDQQATYIAELEVRIISLEARLAERDA